MAVCRAIIAEALRVLKALQSGEEADVDELDTGLEAISNLVLDLHEARGPLTDIDVTGDYTAGENERLRVQAGLNVTITLPNAATAVGWYDPYDYGFAPPALIPAQGSANAADGWQTRAPRDGARVEIVGTAQALYFYRADLNAWTAATGLTLDGECPLNGRYASALAAMVAERIAETLPGGFEPTPGLSRRFARANATLMLRPGVARDLIFADYL